MDKEMQFTVTCGINTVIICNFGWHNPVFILKRLESEGNMNDGNPFDASRWKRGTNHLCSAFPPGKLHFSSAALAHLFANKTDWQFS